MKFTAKQITKKSILAIMIILTGMLILNSSIYIHTHVLADGTIISHAHPYHKATQDQPDKAPHHHTNAQLVFFEILNLLFFLAAPLAFAFLKIKKHVYQTYWIQGISYTSIIASKGRAPPVLLAI